MLFEYFNLSRRKGERGRKEGGREEKEMRRKGGERGVEVKGASRSASSYPLTAFVGEKYNNVQLAQVRDVKASQEVKRN